MSVRAVLDELLRDPDRLDLLLDRLVARIRQRVPEYDPVPEAELRQGNRRIVVAALGHLRENRLPDEAELREITTVGTDRAMRGISLMAVLAAYRVAGEEFWDLLAADARRAGATDADLLVAVRMVWRWLDFVTVAAAAAHREVELRSAREDEQRIGDALRALLTQPTSDAAGRQYLLQLGLDPARGYAALRGRPAGGVTVSVLREAVPDGGLVVAVVQQDVLGLLPSPVDIDPALGTFAIGPVHQDPHTSYLAASRVLSAALRLGLRGSHRLESLRLRAVAVLDGDMTRVLVERLVDPLRAKGPYGMDIWRSTVCFLRHGSRVEETADALHVHANTLRHRLAQFAELTGADLRDPDDLAEIWWLSVAGPP